jgi:hypothetical protein
MAAKHPFAADDPLPLFLSERAGAPNEPYAGKARNKGAVPSHILKTGILLATAVAIVFGLLSIPNPLALFASAEASLAALSAGRPSAPPAAPVQIVATVPAPPPIVTIAPTREEIAAALRTAHQGQPEIRQPPAAAALVRRLDADELAVLLKRAKGLITIGDIAAARLLLERAADAEEASAALLLAETYDPAVLGTPDARSITPDPAMARSWYQKAAQFGSPDAQQRFVQMQN